MDRNASSRFFTGGAKKPGLPPGTLVFSGTPQSGPVKMHLFDYDLKNLAEVELNSPDDALQYRQTSGITWIDIVGVHDTELVRQICSHHGIHPLVVEDIVHTQQRPKVEDFGDHIYVVIKMLYFDSNTSTLTAEQVSVIIGKDFILSFQEKAGDVFEPIRPPLATGERFNEVTEIGLPGLLLN